jgi:hypothetical protein
MTGVIVLPFIYYIHLLYISTQLDHHQAVFHEMYYSLLNRISNVDQYS